MYTRFHISYCINFFLTKEMDPKYTKAYNRRGISNFYLGLWRKSIPDLKFCLDNGDLTPKETKKYIKHIEKNIEKEGQDYCSEIEFDVYFFLTQDCSRLPK